MKRKLLLPFFFNLIILSCASHEPKENILNSKNIAEIEDYISKAHPEDPKKRILQQRVIALKNAEWVKGKKDAKPMAARPLILDFPAKNSLRKNSPENEALFKKLLEETPEEHKQKTIKLLNNMFSQEVENSEAIVLIKNNSDCNLVLAISGKKFYQLAVPSKGENSLVLDKGAYNLSGSVCDVSYKSSKDFSKSMVIILGNPEEKNVAAIASQPEKTTVKSTVKPKKSSAKKGKRK
jgi:hypothetical protein